MTFTTRVDGKDTSGISMAHRRLSFDCKSRPVFSHQSAAIASQTRSSDDMEKVSSIHECTCTNTCYFTLSKIFNATSAILFSQVSALLSKDVTSDDNLAETIHHEHFAGQARVQCMTSCLSVFPEAGILTD